MYSVDQRNPRLLAVRCSPRLPRAIGMLLLLSAGGVAWLVFPTRVVLRCERGSDRCALVGTNPFRERTTSFLASELVGGRLEQVDDGEGGTSYRVLVELRRGDLPFTSWSIGTSRALKERAAARIATFARDPSLASLEVEQDERLLFLLVSLGLAVLGLPPLLLTRTASCVLDLTLRTLLVERVALWRRTREELPFAAVASAEAEASGEGRSALYRLVLRLRSGETIPLTDLRQPFRPPVEAAAEAINARLRA